MEKSKTNLDGNAPDESEVAIVLIDVINDLEFPEGDQLLETALPAARNIARLKERAREAKVPIIYVNDNFGRWRSDFKKIVDRCLHSDVRGRPIAELLVPDEDDYFVLKPKHSGFFSTTLDLLLEYLGVRTLIVAGFAGNNCVLFTANDAYMRDFKIFVPEDCVVSNTEDENRYALKQMETVLKADTTASPQLDLKALSS